MTYVDDFWNLIDKIWGKQGAINNAVQTMPAFSAIETLELYWKSLTPEVQAAPAVKAIYLQRKVELEGVHAGIKNPITGFIEDALDNWLIQVEKYATADPKTAKANLAALSAHVIETAAASAVIDYGMGALPNGLGEASSTNTKTLLKWLGFGAVLTAVAHDPVKIGLLRPYQDSLEQTFRNRRPDSGDLFLAYQQRSLSQTKIVDVDKITDAQMNSIESENEAFYDAEISKWGYSVIFSNSLKDAATKTLNFSQLSALAKQGLYTRGMGIYSLWGAGLDRKLMVPALAALDQQNQISNYQGFRAQIEPAYIEGILTETELKDYWNKIHVPADVIASMLPRFKKKREAYILNNNAGAPAKERDLTVSQLQSAYQNLLLDRAAAQNSIITLGYSLAEAKIFLDLAELRRKLPSAQTLKKLPLSDYEKAYKNGLIDENKVLSRMAGEYTADDIALEKALLKIGKA
jgi:hypothetical protein